MEFSLDQIISKLHDELLKTNFISEQQLEATLVDTLDIFTVKTERSDERTSEMIYLYLLILLLSCTETFDLARIPQKTFDFGFSELNIIAQAIEDINKDVIDNITQKLKLKSFAKRTITETDSKSLERIIKSDLAIVNTALGFHVDVEAETPEEEALQEQLDEEEKDNFEEKRKADAEFDAKKRSIEHFYKVDIIKKVNAILDTYDKVVAQGYMVDLNEGTFFNDGEPKIKSFREGKTQLLLQDESGNLYGHLAVFIQQAFEGIKAIKRKDPDITKLIKNKGTTQYVPYRIVEFINNARVSPYGEEVSKVYNKGRGLWEATEGHTQRTDTQKYLTDLFYNAIFETLDYHKLWEDEGFKPKETDFDGEIIREYTNISQRTRGIVADVLDRLVDTMVTFAFLRKTTGTKNDWASAEWIISLPLKKHKVLDLKNSNLMRTGFSNTNVDRAVNPISFKLPLAVTTIYKHLLDPELASKTPLFAFKMADALKRQGKSVGGNKNLMGMSYDGNPIYVVDGKKGDIDQSLRLTHNYMAGSRSGKGVQINVALTKGLIEGKPTGIIDNKPDTGVPYYELFGSHPNGTPKGFFLQGGASFSSGAFAPINPNTISELNWNTNPLIWGRTAKLLPKWFTDSGGNNIIERWDNEYGYLVYMRGMLLIYAIINARLRFEGDANILGKLGGKQGINALFDEITETGRRLGSAYLTKSGYLSDDIYFGNGVWDDNVVKKYQEYKKEKGKGDKADLEKAERIIAEIKENYLTPARFTGIYFADFLKAMNLSMASVKQLSDLGIKNKNEQKVSNIYIVGQRFNVEQEPKKYSYESNKDGTVKDTGLDIKMFKWFPLIFNFNADTVLGPYADTDKGTLRSVAPVFNEPVNTTERWWTFSNKHTPFFLDKFGEVDKQLIEDFKMENLGGSLQEGDKVILFKPFLTLSANQGTVLSDFVGNLGDEAEKVKQANSDPKTGDWDPRIGIIDYIKDVSGGQDPTRGFVKMAEIANYAVKQMGYDGDWLDFCMDMRPEWIFTVDDLVTCIREKRSVPQLGRYQQWKKRMEWLSEKPEFADEYAFATGGQAPIQNQDDDSYSSTTQNNQEETDGSGRDFASYWKDPDEEIKPMSTVSDIPEGDTVVQEPLVEQEVPRDYSDADAINREINATFVDNADRSDQRTNEEKTEALVNQQAEEQAFERTGQNLLTNMTPGSLLDGVKTAAIQTVQRNRQETLNLFDQAQRTPYQQETDLDVSWCETYEDIHMAWRKYIHKHYKDMPFSRITVSSGKIFLDSVEVAPLGQVVGTNVLPPNLQAYLLKTSRLKLMGEGILAIFLQKAREITIDSRLSVEDCLLIPLHLDFDSPIYDIFAKCTKLQRITLCGKTYTRQQIKEERDNNRSALMSNSKRSRMVNNGKNRSWGKLTVYKEW